MSIFSDMLDMVESKVLESQGKKSRSVQRENAILKQVEGYQGKTKEIQLEIKELRESIQPIGQEIEKLRETTQPLKEDVDGLKEIMQSLDEKMNEVQHTVQSFEEKVEGIRTDINDKIHSENVKCYRNIKGLLTEFYDKIEEERKTEVEEKKNPVKGLRFFAAFAFIDFILLGIYILYSMGYLERIVSTFM